MTTANLTDALNRINAQINDLMDELELHPARKGSQWYLDRVRALEGLGERRVMLREAIGE